MLDVEKIRANARPLPVASYLGIKMVRSGKNTFIRCPAHEAVTGKADRNVSNCILGDSFERAFYCFSCGAKGDLIDFVAYEEELDRRKDFGKILKIIADSCGIDAECHDTNRQYNTTKKEKTEEFILSPDEYELLKIDPIPYANIYKECIGLDMANSKTKIWYQKNPDYRIRNNHLVDNTVFLDVEHKQFSFSECRSEYIRELMRITDKNMEKCNKLLNMSCEEIRRLFNNSICDYDIICALEQIKFKQLKLNSIKQKLENALV